MSIVGTFDNFKATNQVVLDYNIAISVVELAQQEPEMFLRRDDRVEVISMGLE